MFERFTERARKVVVLAQEQAFHFDHEHIGTEHLLLGLLLEEEGIAARALNSLNVTLDEVREQVEGIVGYGEEGAGRRAPFTSRSKRVLESSLRESLQLGHDFIGTEHILLGLIGDYERIQESEEVQELMATAMRVLFNLNVDPNQLRQQVTIMLGSPRRRSRQRPQRSEAEREKMKAPSSFDLHHILRQHQDNIRALAWSPDGQTVASASSDATICIWNASTGSLVQTLKGHIGPVNSVAWSLDGMTLASGADDSTVRLWDTEKGRASRTFQGDGYAISSISWAPNRDCPLIAFGVSDGGVRLWNTATGQTRELGKHESWVNSVAWSPDGKTLTSGADDSTIHLWDVEQGTSLHTFLGHSHTILNTTWSPDGKVMVSAAGEGDPTVRVWNPKSGRQTNVLEGHTKGITSVSFSADGRLLASKSYDNKVLLWRTDTWLPVAELPEAAVPHGGDSLAFHPSDPRLLATLGEDDTAIRIWKLDLAELLSQPRGEAVKLTSAKVILVGESNVGKSCLAMRLATDSYPEPTQLGTTHGMQLWWVKPEHLDPTSTAPEGEQRNVVLWDMGGQDEYRLIHQLFLNDTALALIFLDPTRGHAAFQEVEAWNMRLEKQLGGRSVAKLLVGSKMDQPSGLVDSAALKRLVETCGFAGYYETSALTRRGIDELKRAVNEHVDWESVATASRLEQFQRIRDEITRRRDEKEIVLPLRELKRAIREAEPDSYDEFAVVKVAEQLAVQGIIAKTRLVSGEQALVLRIEEIERYAGSLIVAARNNPHGVPALEERTLASPALPLPGIEAKHRLPRYQEIVILECITELLIEHGICFRHGGLLIFPTLFPNTEVARNEKLSHSVSLYYDFTGAIDNIYASLIAQLAISGEFGEHRLEPNRVEFDEPEQGVCGIRQIKRQGGLAHIDLFFAEDTEQERRNFFINFVEDHLRHQGVEVKEHQAIKCRGCGHEISEDIVQENVARGQKDVLCPYCRTPTLISEGVKAIREREQESDLSIIALRTDLLRTNIRERTKKDVQEAKETVSGKSKKQPVDETQPIRILHLSDLHFTKETSPGTKLQWLIDDLKSKDCLGCDSLEYVVISGDMTDKGQEEGFERAREFVSKIIEEFGLSAQRCIFVPGNHDVPDQLDVYRMGLPEQTANLSPHEYVIKDDIALIRDESRYPDRLRKFSDAFYHKIVQRPYPLEYERQGIAHLFAETRVQFLTLNSCWEIDRFHRKRASIHPDAVAHLIRKANEQVEEAKVRGELGKDAKVLRIGVWHHAVAGPEMLHDTDFIGHLQNNGVKVCLHGDVHEMRRDLIGYWHAKKVYIVGAGSFGSPATGRPESIPRLYNLLEVQRDLSSLRVHTRSQRAPDSTWQGWYEWPVERGNSRVPYFDISLVT